MIYIKLNAVDALFFRDGRPFTMGDDNIGTSLFPPPPSVLRGMVRTLLFADQEGDVSLANTREDPTANVTIDLFALADNEGELLFPMPADLTIERQNQGKSYNPEWLLQTSAKDLLTSSAYPLSKILHTDPQKPNIKLEDPFGKVYLTAAEMQKYISGEKPDIAVNIRDWITQEPKVGIGRCNDLRTASDTGLLYQIQMQRPESLKKGKLSIIIGYNGLAIQGNYPFVRLGGEGKLAEFTRIESSMIPVFPHPEILNAPDGLSKAKMYLSTPALFHEGWKPEALFRDYGIDVEACVIGRYQSYGGWDMVHRRPKSMFKGVPAGSVYYLTAKDPQKLQDFMERFHGKRLTHSGSVPEAYERDGFGIVWFARYQQVPHD